MTEQRFKGYKPRESGLKEIGRAEKVQQLCMDAARAGMAFAESADPSGEGEYSVSPADVVIGWKNEVRGGAILENSADNAWYIEREYRNMSRAINVIENT